MKSYPIKYAIILRILSFILILSIPAIGETNKEKADKLDFYIETGFEYNDNIYSFSESQKSIYNENDPGDKTSDRFKDMDSISDYIIEPEIGLRYKRESPFGGQFRLIPRLRYNYYINNVECSYPEGSIKFEQPVYENGELAIEGKFLYGFFKKNYLSGAEDLDEGNINRSERIYSPAEYNEYEGSADYKHKLIRKRDNLYLSGLSIQPFAGAGYRIYNSDFGNRNQNLLLTGLALNLEFLEWIDLKTAYTYDMIFCPGNEELVLFDENSYGSDVNADGELHKNAPLFTKIDRSCVRHTIEINPCVTLFDDLDLYLGYKFRKTIYNTDNELDTSRYNQKKDYMQIEAGIRYKFMDNLSGRLEWKYTKENDSDDGNSRQNRFIGEFMYSF